MGVGGYLCLVNGTGYAWRKMESYSYQMNEATWYDHISAFQTNTVYFEFSQPAFGNSSDDEAWADYQMEGTNFRFRLWANARSGQPKIILRLTGMNTVSNHQHDEINLGFRSNPTSGTVFNGVTCVIAGRDGAFVTTSPSPLSHKDWMARWRSWLGNLSLRELCIPATHNSGMFRSSSKTLFGSPIITLCQSNSIAEQSRWAYASLTSDPFWTKRGASGDWMGYIVDQINEFTSHNAEVVILNISHAYNIAADYREFTQSDWERFFSADLDRLNNSYSASHPNEDLTRLSINTLTNNGTQAAVILRFNCNKNDSNNLVDLTVSNRHGAGYFYYNSFPLFDKYANTDTPKAVIDNQITKMGQKRDNASPKEGECFMLGFALTQTETWHVVLGLYPPLLDWARHSMNTRVGELYDRCWGRCFPNIISLDCVEGTDALAMCVAINEWQRSK